MRVMSIKKMANGKWYASIRYRRQDGTLRQVKKQGFATKKEAKIWEIEQEQEHANNICELTLKVLKERYLVDMKKRVKVTTYIVKSNEIQIMTKMLGLDKFIVDIHPLDVKQIINTMFDGGLAVSTLREYKSILCTMFKYAQKYYGLIGNPVTNVDIPKKDEITEQKIKYWTQKQS